MLAALGAGFYPTLKAAAGAMASPVERLEPAMDEVTRSARLIGWGSALG